MATRYWLLMLIMMMTTVVSAHSPDDGE